MTQTINENSVNKEYGKFELMNQHRVFELDCRGKFNNNICTYFRAGF